MADVRDIARAGQRFPIDMGLVSSAGYFVFGSGPVPPTPTDAQLAVRSENLFIRNNQFNSRGKLELLPGMERTILIGTFLAQKPGDGSVLIEHTRNTILPIVGMLSYNLTVDESFEVKQYTIERCFAGWVDEKLTIQQNYLTSLNDIPTGAEFSYRNQLQIHGIIPKYFNC